MGSGSQELILECWRSLCLKDSQVGVAGSVLHTLEHGCTTAGRKSGKGCYVYAGRKKSVNSQAENILKKYTIENKGRYCPRIM